MKGGAEDVDAPDMPESEAPVMGGEDAEAEAVQAGGMWGNSSGYDSRPQSPGMLGWMADTGRKWGESASRKMGRAGDRMRRFSGRGSRDDGGMDSSRNDGSMDFSRNDGSMDFRRDDGRTGSMYGGGRRAHASHKRRSSKKRSSKKRSSKRRSHKRRGKKSRK